MLFDLRGRGRRRTIQGVYLLMAVLMAGGLVLVGVGTGGGGGLLNAFTNNGSSSGQKAAVSAQETAALKATRQNPSNATAWGSLLEARWTSAGQGANYNASAGTFTASGKQELSGAVAAWTKYASLTSNPDPSLAILAARAYVALGNYSGAADAWEKETEAAPSEVKGYECLAINAYSAGQSRKGDLAAAKALTLLPKAQQTSVKSSFTSAKGSKSSAQQLAAQC
jgi:tetratricopeptide (TPR) repeat protein